MRKISLVASLAAALATASVAAAGETERSARIAYADLDLGTPQGVAELERRVRTAARDVCTDPRDGEMLLMRRACVRGTIAEAVPRIHDVARRAGSQREGVTTELVVRVPR